MGDDHKRKETVHLMEEGWLFATYSTQNQERCNSDPASSSRDKGMFGKKSSSLLRTPSLPPNLGRGDDEDWDDEDDGPRMGDLIMQAMPCKLSRAPSPPPCRVKKETTTSQASVSRAPPMSKLSRRSSLDPSLLLLPPKHIPKGMKANTSSASTSKNLLQRRPEMPSRNMESMRGSKSRSLERSMSSKTLSDKEANGFRDSGFKFDKERLCPVFANKLASLQIKEETEEKVGSEIEEEEEEEEGEEGKRHPSLSEVWNATQRSHPPQIPKWVDGKGPSEDMKAKIKFWARAVASNVRQEC